MLEEDIFINGPYSIKFESTEDEKSKNMQLVINKKTVNYELIQKQMELILKLKNDRDRLTEVARII